MINLAMLDILLCDAQQLQLFFKKKAGYEYDKFGNAGYEYDSTAERTAG
jgi:hypothetical protein